MGQIQVKYFELFVSKVVPWNVQANDSNFKKFSMVALTSKLQLQGFFWRIFYS